MNKKEYIQKLKQYLKNLPEEERKDALYDYEEHFRIGVKKGRKESELSKSLGNPKEIAKQIKADYLLKKAESKKSVKNIIKAVLATVGLGFLNLIFILGPFLGLVGILAALYATSIAIVVAGLATLIISIIAPLAPYVNLGLSPMGISFLSISAIAFGMLFFTINIQLTRLFYKLTTKYLRFNINIIKSGEKE